LGNQGSGRRDLALHNRERSSRRLQEMVWLGDALEAGADQARGTYDEEVPLWHPEVHAAPVYERRHGRNDLKDPADQAPCTRLPEPRELQECDPLPLWRPGPQPTLNPEEPERLIKELLETDLGIRSFSWNARFAQDLRFD